MLNWPLHRTAHVVTGFRWCGPDIENSGNDDSMTNVQTKAVQLVASLLCMAGKRLLEARCYSFAEQLSIDKEGRTVVGEGLQAGRYLCRSLNALRGNGNRNGKRLIRSDLVDEQDAARGGPSQDLNFFVSLI